MTTEWESIEGGICAAKGFRAAGVTCGIKNPDSPKRDLMVILSDFPAETAGVFTQNEVKAAPVRLSQTYLKQATPKAIVANSGNANACTGTIGMDHARRMADTAAKALGIRRREVLVCSTGIIGLPMPIERIEAKMPELAGSLGEGAEANALAAEAIMTSDTRPKSEAIRVKIGGKTVTLGAIAKGAGMINPNMATMLCFVTTDAKISKAELRAATREATDLSFNRITIDGDMSTNDTVLVMANGQAGNRAITKGGPGGRAFREALTELMRRMAKKIVADGERVTKLVEVVVKGAYSSADAEKVARAVANSKLVKCSWNGNDPNWGRVIHAVGYSGARIREEMVDIYFDGRCAAKHGLVSDTPLEELQRVVSGPKFRVCIDLNLGSGEYNIYTADLSPEYVLFNREEYAVSKMKR
ncbi:MAG: bifunctional glutamate N-acetyltransferase/amino-acid acetyltransferase ArgJ [Verrucomicrobiae bacterium]|nr:bifunctional glutamate N-acetyltransferase/amino-acid acetyltransferase ArgJ [Verrucomicrobiae bacterium]